MTSANVSVEFFFRTFSVFWASLTSFHWYLLLFSFVCFNFFYLQIKLWCRSFESSFILFLFFERLFGWWISWLLFFCFLIHYAIKQCCNQDSSWVCHRAGALSHLLGCRFSFRGCRGCRGGCRCGCGGCRKRVTICKCHHLFIIHGHTNTLKWKKRESLNIEMLIC